MWERVVYLVVSIVLVLGLRSSGQSDVLGERSRQSVQEQLL